MHSVDQELLSRLLDEHSAALVLYAQQLCTSPEDVVQEAFIRLMQVQPLPTNSAGWLYKVVRNEAISQSRSQGRRTRHEAAAAKFRETWFRSMEDDALDAAAIVAAMETLSVHDREVIVLRLWSGLSFDEIGELVGRPTSTVHRWYETGIAELRAKWSKSCPVPETRT